jgi:PAS domain S-box-containing protein
MLNLNRHRDLNIRSFSLVFALLALVIFIIEIMNSIGLSLPAPGSLLIIVVTYAAFIGGRRLGFMAAAATSLYLSFYLSDSGHLFRFNTGHWIQFLTYGGSTIIVATLLDNLRHRAITLAYERGAQAETEYRFSEAIRDIEGYAIIMLDTKGCIRSWNKGAQRVKGWTDEEIIGQHFSRFYPEEDINRGKLQRELDVASTTGRYEEEGWRLKKDGTRFWASVTITAVHNKAGDLTGFIKVTRDLTQKKAEEDQLRSTNASLRALNDELEAFSYSVSHDLRTPLRGVDGFSQALIDDYGSTLDDTAKLYLNYIRSGVQRMGHLIDDLLSLARLSRMEMKLTDVNLSELAEQIVAELRRDHPDRKINIDIEPHIVGRGDRGLLRVTLQNLISNAWKFTQNREDPFIQFAHSPENGKTVYFVRDNGAGFDMRYYNKLFGAFQRLHSAKEFSGTGIGLATVRRVIYRHGGNIWAEAEPDKGATFFFTLWEQKELK